MNVFKNLAVNLKAKGPAVVIISWIAGVTLLGLYGNGEMADKAFSLLAFAGGAILTALALRT